MGCGGSKPEVAPGELPALLVSGAVGAGDGIYRAAGIFNGKARYVHETNPRQEILWIHIGDAAWHITTDREQPEDGAWTYQSNGSGELARPATSGWQVDNGRFLPTVSEVRGAVVAATLEYMGLWRDERGRTFPPMPSPLPGCRPQEGGKYYWSRDVAASVQQLVDRIAREGHTVGYLALQYPCGEGVAVFESVGPAEHFRRKGAGGSAGRSTCVRVPGVVGVIEAQGGGWTNAVYKITLDLSTEDGLRWRLALYRKLVRETEARLEEARKRVQETEARLAALAEQEMPAMREPVAESEAEPQPEAWYGEQEPTVEGVYVEMEPER